jgi:hypothetical protein
MLIHTKYFMELMEEEKIHIFLLLADSATAEITNFFDCTARGILYMMSSYLASYGLEFM